MPEDIGHFKVILEGEVDRKIGEKFEKDFEKGSKKVTNNFENEMAKVIEKSRQLFEKTFKFFGIKPTHIAAPGATYQSMTNKENLQRLTLPSEIEQKEKAKSDKATGLKIIGILTGISYTLTKVPSILHGVLKMVSFGFLLILKPLADLLAMILLPIAKLLIDFGNWINKIAGGGMTGMLVAAIIGLILALISGIAIASLTSALITGAIESLVIGTIGATILVGLASGLIVGLVTKYIAKLFGVDPDTADAISIAAGITTLVLVALGMITFPEIIVLVGTALALTFVTKFLNSIIFEKTNVDIGNIITDKIAEIKTSMWTPPTEPGYTWHKAGGMPGGILDPGYDVTQPKKIPQVNISITGNNDLINVDALKRLIKMIANETMNTNNIRGSTY